MHVHMYLVRAPFVTLPVVIQRTLQVELSVKEVRSRAGWRKNWVPCIRPYCRTDLNRGGVEVQSGTPAPLVQSYIDGRDTTFVDRRKMDLIKKRSEVRSSDRTKSTYFKAADADPE